MHVTVLREVPEDSQLAISWNRVAMCMERPEVFFTHQWSLAASRAFAEKLRPLVCFAYDSDRLCGIASLATVRESPHNAFFLTASTADYCDILSPPDRRSAVLGAIFDELRKLGVRDIELANIPSDSATLREIPLVATSRSFLMYERAAYDCGVILFSDDRQRQSLAQSVRQKDKEKRGLKKMAQLGPVRLTHLAVEQAEDELTSIFSAQISRFLATRRLSPLLQPERRSFLIELTRLLGRAGWLKISRLEINNQPVAWNYGFRFSDSWIWYLPTFETQHENLSPGSCLLRLLIEDACLDPSVIRMDLGLGEEAYKQRFASAVSPTRSVQLSTSRLRHGEIVCRHRLKKIVEQSRAMETAIRRTRDRLRGLRGRFRIASLTATAASALRRATRCLASTDEVLLFEAPQIEMPHDQKLMLAPLDWKQLADAAIGNAEDHQTLNYLMRCAARLKDRAASGFILRAPDDAEPRHFLWVGACDGFYLSEIDHKLQAPDPGAVMIFDCWTPTSRRGHGYYVSAIRLAAFYLQQQQKRVWIFSGAKNRFSLAGIYKAGFWHRYSLVRENRLGRSTLSRRDRSVVC